jgi:hypothetical protein
MQRLLFFFLLAMSFLSLSCSKATFSNLEELKNELGIQNLPEQKDYPQDDGIILYEIHNVDLSYDSNWDLSTNEEVTVVYKIFKNIENYANIEIPLYMGEKLQRIEASTLIPDGRIVPLKSKDFYEIKGVGDKNVFYSDREVIKFTFPSIEKNSILYYKYTIAKNYPFVFDEWTVQHSLPVLRNVFRLTAPVILLLDKNRGGVGWTWRYKSYNFKVGDPVQYSNVNPDKTVGSEKVTFTWAKHDIPQFRFETYMPPYRDLIRYVKFSPYLWGKWDDVSKWYYDYFFKKQIEVTYQISDKAKSLTKNLKTEEEKIEALSNFVQSIRYVAIELGEGSIVPSFPNEVLERGYGDCKDKATLLFTLLKSIGIKASPVLVLTADLGELDTNFPSWYFNHMILKVTSANGHSFWIDPTVNLCPINKLPWQCEGINVLVINENGTGKIEKTPEETDEDNSISTDVRLELNSDLSAEGSLVMKFMGQPALYYRNLLNDITDSELNKICKSFFKNDLNKIEVSNSQIYAEDTLNQPLIIKFKYYIPDVIINQGDLFFLDSDLLVSLTDLNWASEDVRLHPVILNYPSKVEKNFSFNLSNSKLKLRNSPKNIRILDRNFSFIKEYELSIAGIVQSSETMLISSKKINSNDYKSIKRSIDQMLSKSNEKIILVKE